MEDYYWIDENYKSVTSPGHHVGRGRQFGESCSRPSRRIRRLLKTNQARGFIFYLSYGNYVILNSSILIFVMVERRFLKPRPTQLFEDPNSLVDTARYLVNDTLYTA